ncbi:MAG: type II toxin-antitoxin system PemK/MazF family toxin [Chloroflexi bacterium]|nr:type II toxin-antitoxin system PemK/MazF family toxin [Chloroflexota bacterium]
MSASSWQPQRGEVVLVRFPFINLGGQVQVKPRPAVVISGQAIHTQAADVLIAAISSRPASRPLGTDYAIAENTPEARAAGLKTASWVKISNLATVPKTAVARRIGKLTPTGLEEVESRLRLAIDL